MKSTFSLIWATCFLALVIMGVGCASGDETPDTGPKVDRAVVQDTVITPDAGPEVDTTLLPDVARPMGTEGGECYPNKSCNTGLTCVSGICVKLPADSGVPDTKPIDTISLDKGVDTVSHETIAPIPDILVSPDIPTLDASLTCGNNIVEQGEACDDGNTVDGDECNANCSLACIGGKTFNLNCYIHMSAPTQDMYWRQAQQYCEDRGMHLVTISNAAENAFVRNTLGVPNSTYIWLGFHDMDKEGTWKWVNGEGVSFTAWAANEPSNSNAGEDCAMILRTAVDWFDHPCESLGHATVCESEPISISQKCGNGVKEGGEACDDGDRLDGDECNAACMEDCTGGRTFQLQCYRMGPTEVSWQAGQTYCQSLGLEYTAISSQEEMDFVSGYRDEVANNKYLWLGFNDAAVEGTWVWSNEAEASLYTNWTGVEPNNGGGTTEEDCCTVFRATQDWYDHPCDQLHIPVCEN
ncbi:MAG: lectin-like protein [Pseudomonadota bacterium]